ncbi:uncharacterized protein LOC128549974 [Mercenaria mercenaria]|uniref:uncharacterized protein LOC128549974 n=1 Tax=Mercenaria mercenaria TaxID=6596 RepID=UPI00234E8F02|nr:uncharacterized protein LOC128549974 [Mercenaria mercenaria]
MLENQKMFSWSIEHIAELRPADIDEMPVHQTHSVMPDRETEERAQRAIEQFFANNLIHPSPWSDPKKSKKKNILPVTPASQGSGSKQAEDMITELQGSIQKTLPHKHGMVDSSCQTMLSLPVDFDMQKVLGAYMSQDGNVDEGNQQDMLSTSSLRRKLFFHGDTSSLAPSPVKGVNLEPCSPVFTKQTQPNWERTTPLRNTPNFSSSPIKSAGTPQYRRRSSDPEFLASPELSPIVHGNLPSTGRKSKSRSSGVFQAHSADFEISPVSDFCDPHSGRDSPMSPIPYHGISPDNHEEDFRPKFEDSPGFSPIRPPKTPIRKILRRSQEESYIQNECCDSEEENESVTPVSTNAKLTSNSLTPVDAISPIRQSPKHTMSGTLSKSHSCTDLQHTMDFESVPIPRDNILTSSLCDTRDFSASADFSDDTHLRTSLSNQDTGYQTASLQSTNQESVSLHTNLTNQFGSLPFNVTNQDTSHMLTNQDKPPVLNLTHHFSMIANQDEEDKNFIPDTNNHKSAPLFPKQKLLFMDDDVDIEHTPKNSLAVRQNFEDSALPDDLSSSQGKMDIDMKTGDLDSVDCVDSQDEEEVLTRARQALAMANSMYPLDKERDKMSAARISPIESLSQKPSEHISSKAKEHQPSASEIAYSIIQRAGEDLARFGSFKSSKTTELTMEGLH